MNLGNTFNSSKARPIVESKKLVPETWSNQDIKWQTLASYFERDGQPIGEVELSVQAYGVYSLPEEWAKLEACGSCDTWGWQVKLSEALVGDGKFNQRELTEEEKKEIENKKKPKTTGKKPEEPSKEEKEKLAKEQEEKDERDRKFKEYMDSLTEEERFWVTKETPTNDSWVNFPVKNTGTTVKVGEKLLLLEEDINEHESLLIEVLKIPPPDEDPKKRPKPKGIPIDEVKPVMCCAIVNMSFFKNNPGEKELEVRIPLMLQETYEKRLARERAELNPKSDTAEDDKDNSKNLTPKNDSRLNSGKPKINPSHNINPSIESNIVEDDYVQRAKAYVHVKISFNKAVNPPLPEKGLPTPKEILKREEPVYKPITADEICGDFKKQLKIAIEAICKEYVSFIGDTRNQSNKKDKGNVISGARNDERDNSINKFLFNFNISKKADLLKEKLKRFIVRIVREKFGKKENVKSVFKNEKDQFYSELFSYLCDEVKICMDQYVSEKKDELHEHIISSYDQSRKEVILYANKLTKESEDKRLIRLSKEYEIIGNNDLAIYYYKSSLTLIKNKDAWLNFATLNKLVNDKHSTEEAIVLSMNEIFANKDKEIKDSTPSNNNKSTSNLIRDNRLKALGQEMAINLLYASIKFIKGREEDAINFMNRIITNLEIKNTGALFNSLIALFYIEKGNTLLFDKHKQTFDRFLLRERNLIPQTSQKKPFKQSLISNFVTPDQMNLIREEAIYSYINEFFNPFNFFEISEKLLKHFITYKHTHNYYLSVAKAKYYQGNYDEVIKLCSEIISKEPSSKVSDQNQLFIKVSQQQEQEKENEKKHKAQASQSKKNEKEEPIVEKSQIPLADHFPISISECYTLRGNAYYMKNNLFNSAEDYVKAIRKRSKNQEYDLKMLYRLGYTFIKRQTWDDAKTVFVEILKINPNFSFAWRYLGLSLMRLGNHTSAEEALSEANLLDIENYENWGFLTLFCLKEERKYQAIECLNELFKTKYSNIEILEEIAESFYNLGEYKISTDIYNRILEVNPGFTKAAISLADLYYHKLNQQDKGVDVLREAMKNSENENQRLIIQGILDELSGKKREEVKDNLSSAMESIKGRDEEMDSQIKDNIDYDYMGDDYDDFGN